MIALMIKLEGYLCWFDFSIPPVMFYHIRSQIHGFPVYTIVTKLSVQSLV